MNKHTSLSLIAVLTLANVECHAAQTFGLCRASAERSATISAAGATNIVITVGAGDLIIRGDEAAQEVVANGQACAFNGKYLEQMQITARREGNTIYLNTALPESESGFPWFNTASMDLTVILPASLPIELQDTAGDIDASHVRSMKIDDGAGDMEITDIGGDVVVSDTSGDIEIERVAGRVEIVSDTSGDMAIADVRRDVDVAIDSSGDIQIERIAGNVHIRQDSSGDIVIRGVKKDAVIDSDSSGDIRVVLVDGDFIVHGDSTGEITHDRIEGKVKIPADRDRAQN